MDREIKLRIWDGRKSSHVCAGGRGDDFGCGCYFECGYRWSEVEHAEVWTLFLLLLLFLHVGRHGGMYPVVIWNRYRVVPRRIRIRTVREKGWAVRGRIWVERRRKVRVDIDVNEGRGGS